LPMKLWHVIGGPCALMEKALACLKMEKTGVLEFDKV